MNAKTLFALVVITGLIVIGLVLRENAARENMVIEASPTPNASSTFLRTEAELEALQQNQ